MASEPHPTRSDVASLQPHRDESAHVHVGDLDGVVSVAEPVPGRDVGLHVAGRVGCSGSKGVSADVGHLPVERPILPLVRTLRGLELRRVPVSLAGEADVDVGYRSGARPRLSAHGVLAGGDRRAGGGVGDAGADAHQRDAFVFSIRPFVHVVAGLKLAYVRFGQDVDPLQPFHGGDGVPVGLIADHGAPFRLIVPHWYAVASVKWLKRIDVLTEPYVGEFQTGHYMYEWPDREHERVTLMRVRARITDPAPGATIATGEYTVRGKAWSGTGPVTDVHVSFTGEGDWHSAKLEPPKGSYQWQGWSLDWEVSDVGRHSLRARATDAAGNVQPDVPPWNRLGYGNNAIEVSYVDVR